MTPDVQRWFDGTAWSEHTRPVPELRLREHQAASRPAATGADGAPAPALWLPADDGTGAPVAGVAPGAAAWLGSGAVPAAPTATTDVKPAVTVWGPESAPAHWGWRVLAMVLDGLLTSVPAVAGAVYLQLTAVPASDVLGRPAAVPTAAGVMAAAAGALLTLVLWFANRVVQQGRTEQSWGKRIVGLRTVHESTEAPLGVWWALVRDVAHVVDAVPLYVGYLAPLWHGRRQTFSDRLTHAVVLRDAR